MIYPQSSASFALTLLALALGAGDAVWAFTLPSSASSPTIAARSVVGSSPPSPPSSLVVLESGSGTLEEDPLFDVRTSYIEVSRQYRRTRYTHDDWLKHRSPDRFLSNLAEFSTSGIYRGILKEVGTVTAIASAVVLWNVFLGEGWVDSAGLHHDTRKSSSHGSPMYCTDSSSTSPHFHPNNYFIPYFIHGTFTHPPINHHNTYIQSACHFSSSLSHLSHWLVPP